jgi:hypothetical protein
MRLPPARSRWSGIACAFTAASLLLGATEASAVTGPTAPVAPGSSVVALGTLPVACGAAFSIDCSGVALSPTLVLTAAHCVPSGVASGRAQVLGFPAVESPGEIVNVARTYVHPDYAAGVAGSDLAILALDEPGLGAEPATLSVHDPSIGAAAAIEGFGINEATSSAQPTALSGSVRIAGLGDGIVEFEPAPNMACDGDSGGPLLVAGEHGVELLGIISQADPACREWGTATWLGSASSRWFIDDVLQRERALAAPTEELPTFQPSDYSSLCELPCAGDTDCPAGTRCVATWESEKRCVPPGLLPGQVDGPCDATCDQCVQLSARVSDCSCYRLCPGPLPEDAAEDAGPTCAVSKGAVAASRREAWACALLFSFLLLGVSRRIGSRRSDLRACSGAFLPRRRRRREWEC